MDKVSFEIFERFRLRWGDANNIHAIRESFLCINDIKLLQSFCSLIRFIK